MCPQHEAWIKMLRLIWHSVQELGAFQFNTGRHYSDTLLFP